jgi:hypothetical protein
MKLFAKLPTDRLQIMSEELGAIYADCSEDIKVAQFARTLSVMMRCELARRDRERDA